MQSVRVIDSHTAGEPTRVVIQGGPELGGGTVKQQLEVLRSSHDWLRTALIDEPRGSEVMVGALLCTPSDPLCATGVIFFNNVGYLGMCGHGALGVVSTLAHLGVVSPGGLFIETPVGVVSARLHPDGRASIRNVPSFRHRHNVPLQLATKVLMGDVAYGGNWFFLAEDHGLQIAPENVGVLTKYASEVRQAIVQQGVTGADGAEIDHIELCSPTSECGADAINFVLCPGAAYDRSPCGTGTSAKVACLAADGKLAPGQVWRQRSVIGGLFEASYERDGEQIVPTITGRAYVNGQTDLLFDPKDPFRFGFTATGSKLG